MNSRFLFFVLTFFLIAACSKDKDNSADLLQGKWTATSLMEDGNEYIQNQPLEITTASMEFKDEKVSIIFSTKYPNFPLEVETYQGNYNSDGKKIEMVIANEEKDTLKWDLNVLVLESKKLEFAGTEKSNNPDEPIVSLSAKFIR
jgi:hypothetical protein